MLPIFASCTAAAWDGEADEKPGVSAATASPAIDPIVNSPAASLKPEAGSLERWLDLNA